MRKVSFALAVGFLLVACGGGEENQPPKTPATPPVATTPPAPTAEAPKEEPKPQESMADLQHKTLKGFVEAFNAHDAKKIAGFYAENASWKMAGVPDSTGRDAIAANYAKLFEGFKDITTAPVRVFKKGDVAIVEWASTATHSGDFNGMKATEKKVGMLGADVTWFTPEGLIKEHHVYYDVATVLSQVGVSKQKARPIPTLPTGLPPVVVSNGAADETKNVDAVKTMNAAMESKKEADFLAASADNIEWDDMTQPQTSKGKAEAKKYFKEVTTAFPDVKSTVNNAWGVGDFVIAENGWSGTHKGTFFGIPATKKSVSVKGLDVFQFKDGKLVHGWSYSNNVDFMTQLGLMPKPGDAKAADPKAGDKKPAAPAGDKKPAAPAGDKKAAPAKK